MDSQRREQIKEHYKYYSTPIALLNKDLECIYTNKPLILPIGGSLKLYMQRDLVFPLNGIECMMITLNGTPYCGRFEEIEDDLLKCELFNSNMLQSMAEHTDFYGKGTKFLLSVEQGISKLRNLTKSFSDAIDHNEKDYSGLCRGYYETLSFLSSAVNNVFEYNTMLSRAPDIRPIEVVAMVKGIVDRCNAILTKCGRYIDFVYDIKKMYINADTRYAFNALVNLIHNALVYSPRDFVPVISLTMTVNDDVKYVFLKAVNETALYSDKSFEDDFNSGFYRLGFGKKIIRRFAEQALGLYIENISDKWASIGVMIPAIDDFEYGHLTFENGVVGHYNTGIPDLLDVKMQEVVELFIVR